jgi:RNA polymerase sigma-70 factor (ECF subfamily)
MAQFDAGDADLLRAAARGEPAAVRRLLDESGPVLYGFVFARVGGDTAAAEDIVQETLFEAVKGAAGFRGEAALSTWLCAIARRRLARYYERERRENAARAEAVSAGDLADVSDVEDRDEMVRALGRLSVVHRQVLVLKYLDDWTVGQIAREIGRTEVQVQSLLQRARDGLRRQLEAWA